MKDEEVNLKELQQVELDILKEFIRVCNELNVKYFLDSGTLLGCIRHGGFIPWDDDIDVSMPREDYEIFLKEGQKLLKNKYFLQTYKTDPEYTMGFAKIRNSETTFIESSVKNLKINHGVYIDIFPLDGYNDKNKIRNFLNKKAFVLYNLQINKKYDFKITHKNNIKGKLALILSNLLYGRKNVPSLLEKKEKIAKKYSINDTGKIYCFFYNATTDLKMDSSIFEEGITKKFENIDVIVPKKYDEYLKIMYGDYMTLPPKEKRIAHHYNEVIDLEKSYKKYFKK